ncbi:MAG: rubrerythrin family protein [bacterium]
MHDMTAGNLRSACGGESMAHMRYVAWGDRAEEEGYPNVARLFRAISFAERVHATNHFTELKDQAGAFSVTSGGIFGLGATSENLAGAIAGERFEIEEMYPVYLNAAKFQGEKGAEISFGYALSAEKIHAEMYGNARKAVEGGKDLVIGPVQICTNCGHTAEGDAPDFCPVCGVPKDRFRRFA